MKSTLVLSLAAFGLAMGVATMFGAIPRGWERWPWLMVGIGCAVWIALRAQKGRFVLGFLGGLIAGMVPPLLQAAFFPVYLAHNPHAAAAFGQLPPSLSPRLVVLLMTPIVGLISGLALGLLAWLAGIVIRRRRAEPAG